MEQLGASYVGKTSDSQLISSTSMVELTACVIVGGVAATFLQGHAMIDSPTSGLKKRYTNVSGIGATYTNSTGVLDVESGDGAKLTVGDYLWLSTSILHNTRVLITSKSTDAITTSPVLGADQTSIRYNADAPGACILAENVTQLSTSGNNTSNGYVAGNIKSALVLDSADALVDQFFKDALPKVKFE